MAILVCGTENCASKVRTPKCHGKEMDLMGNDLVCSECGNIVEVNYCHGAPMRQMK